MKNRTNILNTRINDIEKSMLQAVADHMQVKRAEAARIAIKEAYDRLPESVKNAQG